MVAVPDVASPSSASASLALTGPSELAYNDAEASIRWKVAQAMANQIGKRYNCTKCGSEFIVTKAGNGEINCCGQPMELKK